MIEEVTDLTPYVASAQSTNTLFGDNHDFDAYGKLMTVEPKHLARQAFCPIPNYCRTGTRSKS